MQKLVRCNGKLDCLIYEMLYIRDSILNDDDDDDDDDETFI